jgi:hypothetical protein
MIHRHTRRGHRAHRHTRAGTAGRCGSAAGRRSAAAGVAGFATAALPPPEEWSLAAAEAAAGKLGGQEQQNQTGRASKHGVTPRSPGAERPGVSRVRAVRRGGVLAPGKYSPGARGCNARRSFRRTRCRKRRGLCPPGKMCVVSRTARSPFTGRSAEIDRFHRECHSSAAGTRSGRVAGRYMPLVHGG